MLCVLANCYSFGYKISMFNLLLNDLTYIYCMCVLLF